MKNAKIQSMFRQTCYVLTVLMMLAMASDLQAKKKERKPSTRNIITKINAKDRNFEMNKKVYYMRSDVRISVEGKKAKFSDLKVGMRVSVTARVKSFGKDGGRGKNTYEVRLVKAHIVEPEDDEKKK